MHHETLARSQLPRAVAVEIDGEPLGVVVPAEAGGVRFLAVRLSAFPLDGRVFDSLAEARAIIGEAVRNVDALTLR
jgi:hypothetical protein